MKRVVIVGAGGTGEDVLDFVGAINALQPTYEVLGFLDDDPAKAGATIGGAPVLGPLESAPEHDDAAFVDTLGSPATHRQRSARIGELGIADDRFETVVHPSAVVSEWARLGRGCVVYPFSMIGAGAVLGAHVIVLSHSVVNHHASLGDFSILASGCIVSGRVTIGSSAYLGAGCCLREGVRVGDDALIGAGGVVVEDVPSGQTVAGVPARALRSDLAR